VVASSSRLKPGERGKINVSVDTRGRTGRISKTIQVYANDPKNPVTKLAVQMYIKDRIHLNQYKAAEIFSEKCRDCHIDQGKGKKGWDLFMADCFMCHNAGKNSSLTEMSKKPREYLLRAIREGVENTVMPGWGAKADGPLDEAEIKSLIDVMKD
jgi:cytochrome c553